MREVLNDLSGDNLTVFNAIVTLSEVLTDKGLDEQELVKEITSEDKVLTLSDGLGTLYMDLLGYQYVILMKDNPNNKDFFTGIFSKEVGSSVITDTDKVHRYLPNRNENKMWQVLTYSLKDSVLLFECSKGSMYSFHEVFPLAMAMANGNKVYLLEEGTNGKINNSATMFLYKNVAAAMREPTIPAYLRLQACMMYQEGVFGMILGEEDSIVACEVLKTSVGSVTSIPAEYLKNAITATAGYSTFRIKYSIPMLEPYVWKRPIDVCDIQAVVSPLILNDWIDELANAYLFGTELSTRSVRVSCSNEQRLTEALQNRLETVTSIDGYRVDQYSPEGKLDFIRQEGLIGMCNVISKLWCNREKNIYLQDIAIVLADGNFHVVAPMAEALEMSHDCAVRALVNDKLLTRRINHSLPMCPLTQDYYLAGLSCREVIATYGDFIKQALYYRLSKYFPWDNDRVTSINVQLVTNSEQRIASIQHLLSYNNTALEKLYNDIPEHSNELTVPMSTLNPYGKINRRQDVGGQRVIKISM